MDVELIQGSEADSLLQNESFVAQWRDLCDRCAWATSFQAPSFILPWYQTYGVRMRPLLALMRDQNQQLRALLPLAVDNDDSIIVAGGWHAEYHVWISTAELANEFPIAAVAQVHRAFPGRKLSFRYLPPEAPTQWLGDPRARRLALQKIHDRPLLRFGDGSEIAKSLSKGSNKSRLKQLARLGAVEFKRITDPAEFQSVFPEIMNFVDARQTAVRGSPPFLKDPQKKPFHEAMAQQPGLLHVTVLKVGGRVASAHLGACGRKEVQLGLIAHNPWLSKYSPGKFHIYYLAQMLMKEGYEQLDLTAGGDAYKERFANAWDKVSTLSIHASSARRQFAMIYHGIETTGRWILKKIGIAPKQALLAVQRLRRTHPLSATLSLARSIGRRAWSCRETRIYVLDAADARLLEAGTDVHRDSLADVLAYRPQRDGLAFREFIALALRRFEEGQHIYTCTGDGQLVHAGWLADRLPQSGEGHALAPFEPPPQSTAVLEFHTLPGYRGRGLATRSLQAMLRDAGNTPGITSIFVAVPAADEPAIRLVEKAGCTWHCSLFDKQVVGRRRRWVAKAGERRGSIRPEMVMTPPTG